MSGPDKEGRLVEVVPGVVLRVLEGPAPALAAPGSPAWKAHVRTLGQPFVPLCMVLHCPRCRLQHVDAAEWVNRPHRSHLCAGCGHIWRPADVPTCGVAAIATRGKDDSPSLARQFAPRRQVTRPADATREEWAAAVRRVAVAARGDAYLASIPSHWLEAMRDLLLEP